jgi:hypothetical protein
MTSEREPGLTKVKSDKHESDDIVTGLPKEKGQVRNSERSQNVLREGTTIVPRKATSGQNDISEGRGRG